MPTLRESLTSTLVIIIASAIVIFLIAPLDATEWASSMRAGAGEEGGEGMPGGIFGLVAAFIKITLLMGIPGLITLGVRRLSRRIRAWRAA